MTKLHPLEKDSTDFERNTLATLFSLGKLRVRACSSDFLLTPPHVEGCGVVIPRDTIDTPGDSEYVHGKSSHIIARGMGFKPSTITTAQICLTPEDHPFNVIEAIILDGSPEEIVEGYAEALEKAQELGVKNLVLPVTSNGIMSERIEDALTNLVTMVEKAQSSFDSIDVNILQSDDNFLIMQNIIHHRLRELGYEMPKIHHPPSWNYVEEETKTPSTSPVTSGNGADCSSSLAEPPTRSIRR